MGTKGRWLDDAWWCLGWKGPGKGRGGGGGGEERGGQGKVPCDPKGDRTFLSRFTPLFYLIRNASHDSSDLFPPFLGIILYIDPGRVEHSSLWTQQRHAASRLVASASRPSFPSPLRQTPLQKTCKDHPPPRGCLCFRCLFEKLPDPLEFLTRQLPLRGHKGSYFLNSSATRIPSGVRGVVSYTGCVYICVCVSFHPSWPGSKHFCWGGEETPFDPSDQFLTPLSMGNRCFFSFMEEGRIGESGSVSLLFLEGARWKSIDLLATQVANIYNWSTTIIVCFYKCCRHSISNFALFSSERWLNRFLIFRSISSFDSPKNFRCYFH